MPLWHIYCPEDAYTPADKAAFATSITDLYARIGLPRFYVSVIFYDVAPHNLLIGGEPRNDFVRVSIDHIARRMTPDRYAYWMEQVNATLDPFVRQRQLNWEVHVDETPFELWSIDGLTPPAPKSEAEQRWARENKASPY